jgi:Zn finger protein HypA/HybF involved in hydrogenase expression
MAKIKYRPFSLPCQKCGKPIPLTIQEYKPEKTKLCPHCGKSGLKFADDLKQEIEKSVKKHLGKIR